MSALDPTTLGSAAPRTILVTGGGQGIGRAAARAFLEKGDRVAILEIDPEAGREAESELSPVGDVRFFPCDVADEIAVARAVEEILLWTGRVDVLINNAAIAANRPIGALGIEEWNRVLSVNLTAPFLLAKQCAPHLKKTGKGVILNIASTRAHQSEPHTEAYAASKGGILALTHALAVSLGPEIRVNCVSPGWIDVRHLQKKQPWSGQKDPTGRTTPLPPLSAADHAQHPTGRVGRPEDVAALLVYLSSTDSGFITGAEFIVDGGMTRKMVYI